MTNHQYVGVCLCACSPKVGSIILSRCWPSECQFSGGQHLFPTLSSVLLSSPLLPFYYFSLCPSLLIFCSFLPPLSFMFYFLATQDIHLGGSVLHNCSYCLSFLFFLGSVSFMSCPLTFCTLSSTDCEMVSLTKSDCWNPSVSHLHLICWSQSLPSLFFMLSSSYSLIVRSKVSSSALRFHLGNVGLSGKTSVACTEFTAL